MVNSISAQPSLSYRSHFDGERMAGSVPVWGEASATAETETKTSDHVHSLNRPAESNSPAPSFSFGEFLDIINPLQHIPIVSSFYRDLTGDQLSPVAKIIGGGIYGGPVGFATSVVVSAMDEHGGQDALLNGFSKTASPRHYAIHEDERTAGLKPAMRT